MKFLSALKLATDPIVFFLEIAQPDKLPGLLPGSLTRPDAKSYIENGRFDALSLTEAEREAVELIRLRDREQSNATRDAQLQAK
ncbi:MAG: hypothetical protein LBV54_02650 [Puniceicoccales bacterium]|jgi:hypothetical protein|nr:hypothetical protein [Puniceicoccales bacterium]